MPAGASTSSEISDHGPGKSLPLAARRWNDPRGSGNETRCYVIVAVSRDFFRWFGYSYSSPASPGSRTHSKQTSVSVNRNASNARIGIECHGSRNSPIGGSQTCANCWTDVCHDADGGCVWYSRRSCHASTIEVMIVMSPMFSFAAGKQKRHLADPYLARPHHV